MTTASLKSFYRDKVIVITGAASGIGRALAHQFAQNGAKLALYDYDAAALAETRTQLNETFSSVDIMIETFDVTDEQHWQQYLSAVHNKFGCIDMLINNAGIEGSARPVWATPTETLKRVMDVNFYGMVYGSRLSLPYLATRPWAALVNVSSIFGLVGVPNAADYCASKFAIRGFTESLRSELGQVHPHIQVHLVHPGGINTNITRIAESQAFKQEFLKTQPQDIAQHIAKQVMANQARIVYGTRAKSTHWATRFLPLKWLSFLTAKEMQSLKMDQDYIPDHPGFNLPSDNKEEK